MPEETTATATEQTSGGDGKNTTEATNAGAGTQTATTEAATDITQTAEFKTALTQAVEKKLPQLRRQIAKELTGEKDGQPSVEELKSRAEAAEERARTFETRELVRDHLTDPKNRIGALPENMRAIEKLIMAEIEYEDGKPSNLSDAIKTVKSDAPGLFLQTGSANGGAGRQAPATVDMNLNLRRAAGRAT